MSVMNYFGFYPAAADSMALVLTIRHYAGVVVDGAASHTGDWQKHGLGGTVCERKVITKNGKRYSVVVRRRGLPEYFAGGLAPILVPLEVAAFVVNKFLHRGYGVEVRPTAQPGWWKRFRPLPAEQIIVVGPFASVVAALVEANAIASRIPESDDPCA